MKRKDIAALLPPGFGFRQVKSGHLQILHVVTGRPLRSETGLPLCVSLTPSDHRTTRNEQARIRRALGHLAADGSDRTASATP